MAQPGWGDERRKEVYDAPVYGLPVEGLYQGGGRPVPKQAARTQGPKRPRSIAPPKITGADEQEIAAKRREINESIRVTAGFLALRGQLTVGAALQDLDAELGPFILQEAITVALRADIPAAVVTRQRALLPEAALEVMNTPIGDDQPLVATDTPSGE